MYNMFKIEDLIEINKQFDKGNMVNRASLEFALSTAQKTKDWVTQLAYLIRSIALDHVFEEGNKRTAAAVMIAYAQAHKKEYDIYKVDQVVVQIIKKNINDIARIRRLIKDALW